MQRPHAVVVLPSAALGRRTAQILECSGLDVSVFNDLTELSNAWMGQGLEPVFACLPVAELEQGMVACRSWQGTSFFPLLEEIDPTIFSKLLGAPNIPGIFGLRYAGAPPRAWELISVARRLSLRNVPPPHAPLSWGHVWHERTLATPEDRTSTVETAREFVSRLVSSRHATSIAQLADEMIMNAMFDAPVDAKGQHHYAHRRQERMRLEPQERPTFGFGSDGARIVLSISDPFGGLNRDTVFRGLNRGLTTGTMDTRGGGAGLGLLLIHQTAQVVFFDVIPRQLTQVTAVVELDLHPSQMRKVPGSVHFFRYGLAEDLSLV